MADLRSRLLRPVVALAVLLGLAACSAGVPKTGEVVSVSPASSSAASANPEALQDVGGPFIGQSETEVAVGYMNAMNSGDESRVQRWVTLEARKQVAAWDRRTTTVRVYSVFEPGQEYVSGDRRIVPIKVKLVGQLDAGREWHPATGEDMVGLELENEGANLRVANPGRVIWMRDVNFSRLYASTELFMVPDLADLAPVLAPVPVFVPRAAEDDPEAVVAGVERALELLLAGPRGRYRNLHTAIPPGTGLDGVRYANGVVTVNLSGRFTQDRGSGQLHVGQLRVGQVVWTVSRLLPNAPVRLLVEGRPVSTLGADRFPADRQWRRRDQPLASMWPQRSQERQGDAILFVRQGEIFSLVPEGGQSPRPVELNAPSPKSAPTWSPDRRWMAFLVGGPTGQVLWLVEPDGRAVRATGRLPGRTSAPSWSPDSKQVYLVNRSDAGSRLLRVSRSNLGIRSLALPPLPSGLQPASVAVSPDGAFVLAVADRPDRKIEDAEPVPGGQLFIGQLGPEGVLGWSGRQLAPGLGRIFSPVWIDPVTVGFIAETASKDDLGKLWTVKSDGWDPTAVLNDSDIPIGDIGNNLTADPSGRSLVVTARSANGAILLMVDRQTRSVSSLTFPSADAFDSDPSFASR